jgi:hypothetical protein
MKRRCVLTISFWAVCVIGPQLQAAYYENIGNAPLNERLYQDWKEIMPLVNHLSRVFHTFMGFGNEHFYYQGDTISLNDCLKKYATIEVDAHEVILRPGPAETRTWPGKQLVRYDWLLHIQGGTRHDEEQGTSVFDKYPTMTVFVGEGKIELEKIEFPKGTAILQLEDLRARYLKGLKSSDKEVRGYAAYFLGEVDSYEKESAVAIAKLLDDKDNWVRSMALGVLGRYGKGAEFILPTLRKAVSNENEKEGIKKKFQETIKAIEGAKDRTEARRKHLNILKNISSFRSNYGTKVDK